MGKRTRNWQSLLTTALQIELSTDTDNPLGPCCHPFNVFSRSIIPVIVITMHPAFSDRTLTMLPECKAGKQLCSASLFYTCSPHAARELFRVAAFTVNSTIAAGRKTTRIATKAPVGCVLCTSKDSNSRCYTKWFCATGRWKPQSVSKYSAPLLNCKLLVIFLNT